MRAPASSGPGAGVIDYGETLSADLPTGTVSLQVDLNSNPIVGPANVTIVEAANQIAYVVGNLPGRRTTPVVPLFQELPVPTCEQPAGPEADRRRRSAALMRSRKRAPGVARSTGGGSARHGHDE